MLKEYVRRTIERFGYRVSRLGPVNRFQALEDSLELLERLGYSPRVVIDAGANVGTWSEVTRRRFPTARYHLIEPQRGCAQRLAQWAEAAPEAFVHPVALTSAGVHHVLMAGGGPGHDGTGAWVIKPGQASLVVVEYPSTTLDDLFASVVTFDDRAFLKLDIEGHELTALRGGLRLLGCIEVLFTEVSFFDINDAGRETFGELVSFLHQHGFELFDIVSLSSRARDGRLRLGDAIFVNAASSLLADRAWA